eukprot:SAG31_NODE_5938_length_2249_cov_2.764651_2_plen_76_part_00
MLLLNCNEMLQLATRRNSYRRGDVVTLWSPENENAMLIKRVIGVPGDWVRVPNERNSTRLKHIPQGQVKDAACPI